MVCYIVLVSYGSAAACTFRVLINQYFGLECRNINRIIAKNGEKERVKCRSYETRCRYLCFIDFVSIYEHIVFLNTLFL